MKMEFSSIKKSLINHKESWSKALKGRNKMHTWKNILLIFIFIITAAIFSLAVEYADDSIEYVSEYLTKDVREQLQAELSSERSIREGLESEIENLRGEQEKAELLIENLESKTEETDRVIEVIDAMIDDSSSYSISSIVDYWKPVSVQIYCEFGSYSGSWGSGTAFYQSSDENVYIISNDHVLSKDRAYTPDFCLYRLSGHSDYYYAEHTYWATDGSDWGYILVDDPDSYLLAATDITQPICKDIPSLGDEIVILGYPGIGDQNDITATTGVISGFEGDYFITDAKIDHGNSGGTAILLKDNCWLGIPTYSMTGSIESLGRILNIQKLFPGN